jgi:hypothetical protein
MSRATRVFAAISFFAIGYLRQRAHIFTQGESDLIDVAKTALRRGAG